MTANKTGLDRWEQDYRSAFERDGGHWLKQDLERVELSSDITQVLESTIDLVRACCAFRELDGVFADEFIAMQGYGLPAAQSTRYRLIFLLGSASPALINVPDLKAIDLADLFDMPWPRIEQTGYSHFWLFRNDGVDLTQEEIDELDAAVESDLRFDYDPDEVGFYADPDTWPGALHCCVYDNCGDSEI